MPAIATRPVRLARSSLGELAGRVSVPSYDGTSLAPGVLHVGVGRFHRAHQAGYFDDLAESGVSRRWGVVGASVRSSSTCALLAAQDHLFTVVEAGPSGARPRVVGVVQDFLVAHREPMALMDALCDTRLRLVTLTVTAEAYRPGGSPVFGLLAEALRRRRGRGMQPFTVLSCDNLVANGVAARDALLAAVGDDTAFAEWIRRHVAFPSSMVDRIAPPLGDETRRLLQHRFGLEDPCAVLTEPYRQWVVEDSFCNDRPPLDEVGVEFVPDVTPFMDVKMRMLNGGHCAVGYLGDALGHATSAAAMADPLVRGFTRALLLDEVAATLTAPSGVDLAAYAETALGRMGDTRLVDPISRLTRRGSVRLPSYVVPSLVTAREQGLPHDRLVLVLAAWADHLRRRDGEVEDDLAPVLQRNAAISHVDARPLLADTPGLAALAGDTGLAEQLRDAVRGITERGVAASVAAWAAEQAPAVTVIGSPAPRARRSRFARLRRQSDDLVTTRRTVGVEAS